MSSKTRPRIAIVGAGYWGPNWIRTILGSDHAELSLVCDASSDRLEYISEQFPVAPTTSDFTDILESNEVDGVIIATPPETHANLGVQAFRAEKHVLIEKPLAVTAREANSLVVAAEDAQKILAVGHVFAYNPAVEEIRKTIEQGKLGKFLYGTSSRMNMPPPTTRHSVIWDLAVHDVSIALTVNPAKPVSVTATARKLRSADLFDAATISVEFDNGTITWHHVGWLNPERERRFFVGCEEGAMEFDDTRDEDKLRVFGRGVDSRLAGPGSNRSDLSYSAGEVMIPRLDPTSPLKRELAQFARGISTGIPPIADGIQGLVTVKILEAAELSATRGGASVSID